ncbi:MAG: hypothetical protein EHM61_07170 [Acidobacteria bacterium]|nr:MAG: hypothetical protein EHM61_07170 [Acidobacteriota bacterium]
MVSQRVSLLFLLTFSVSFSGAFAQTTWVVPQKRTGIQIDGFVQEWEGIQGLRLEAGSPGVQAEAISQAEDVNVIVKAVWDKENLYLALQWKDNTWDIEQVLRQQAVWLSPQQQRRDRMLFYDFLKIQISDIDFDYVLWLTPRINNRGPYSWGRLLAGGKRMEKATSPPAISSRQADGTATVEILFQWSELQTKPKEGKALPLTLLLADSDLPGKPLELKLKQLKSLVWTGTIKLMN